MSKKISIKDKLAFSSEYEQAYKVAYQNALNEFMDMLEIEANKVVAELMSKQQSEMSIAAQSNIKKK